MAGALLSAPEYVWWRPLTLGSVSLPAVYLIWTFFDQVSNAGVSGDTSGGHGAGFLRAPGAGAETRGKSFGVMEAAISVHRPNFRMSKPLATDNHGLAMDGPTWRPWPASIALFDSRNKITTFTKNVFMPLSNP